MTALPATGDNVKRRQRSEHIAFETVRALNGAA
jgi:hypothetical protein